MDKKLVEVVQAVLRRSEHAPHPSLSWESFDSESFRCQIGVGYLHVLRSTTNIREEDRTGGWIYTVQVSDFQGRVVTDAEVAPADPSYLLCEELFNHARRAALGGDQILDSMLQVLK